MEPRSFHFVKKKRPILTFELHISEHMMSYDWTGERTRLWRDDQDETAATIWMRLLCRGRHEGIMLIVAGKSLIVF
ncbi:hypothetical protein CN934_25545 [Ensifer sp. MMN_5]|nr:hypothetical protein CN934_25545 [Ensifer sp. MMN_5]